MFSPSLPAWEGDLRVMILIPRGEARCHTTPKTAKLLRRSSSISRPADAQVNTVIAMIILTYTLWWHDNGKGVSFTMVGQGPPFDVKKCDPVAVKGCTSLVKTPTTKS